MNEKAALNGSIEIDQDLTWFGALAGTQNTALLQNINDPRRARVTESQPALEQRSGRAFFLSNNLDAFFDQLFIFRGHFFLWRASGLDFSCMAVSNAGGLCFETNSTRRESRYQ